LRIDKVETFASIKEIIQKYDREESLTSEEVHRLESYVERKEEIVEMLPEDHPCQELNDKLLRRSKVTLKKAKLSRGEY
jgi:hypothetical protein